MEKINALYCLSAFRNGLKHFIKLKTKLENGTLTPLTFKKMLKPYTNGNKQATHSEDIHKLTNYLIGHIYRNYDYLHYDDNINSLFYKINPHKFPNLQEINIIIESFKERCKVLQKRERLLKNKKIYWKKRIKKLNDKWKNKLVLRPEDRDEDDESE